MENLQKLLNKSLKEYEITFSHPWTNNEYPCVTKSIEDISKELYKQIMTYGECNVKIRRYFS